MNVEVSEPPAVVNTTLTAPPACAGVTTVTDVELTFVSEVPAVPPNVMPVVAVKLVPVIVTIVPPAAGPDAGDSDVMIGTAM